MCWDVKPLDNHHPQSMKGLYERSSVERADERGAGPGPRLGTVSIGS